MEKVSVGVGICTCNRLPLVRELYGQVVDTVPDDGVAVVVASDGSEDGTNDWLREEVPNYAIGSRMGNCVNKNRLLDMLGDRDFVFLLEDDVRIRKGGWVERMVEGITATDIAHFTLFDKKRHKKQTWELINGWSVSYWRQSNAAVHTFTREAIEVCGGYTTAFSDVKRCGHGELSRRLFEAGFCGQKSWKVQLDAMTEYMESTHPKTVTKVPSWKKLSEIVKTREAKLASEKVWFRPIDTLGEYERRMGG